MPKFKKLVVISRSGWTERDGVQYFQDNDGYYIDKLAPLFDQVIVWSRPMLGAKAPAYKYQFTNSNVEVVNIMRGASLGEYPKLIMDSINGLKDLQGADVIYSFVNTIRGCIYTILAANLGNSAVITYNGVEWQKAQKFAGVPYFRRKVTAALEHWSMKAAGVRIVTGPLLRKQFLPLGPTYMVAPVSRLMEKAVNSDHSLLQQDIPQFLCLAHLHHRKFIHTLIEACHITKSRGEKFKFHIVGDGPERSKLEDLTKEYELENDIVFHGYIANPDKLSNILSKVDILLFAGLIEGFPRTVWESIYFGIHVITAPVADIETLFNSEQVTLIPNNTAQEFADAMIEAVRNPGRTNQRARSAKKKLKQLFPYSLTEQFHACIQECLNKKP